MSENFFSRLMTILFSTGLGALLSFFITQHVVQQTFATVPRIAIVNYAEVAALIDLELPEAVREKQADKLAILLKKKVDKLKAEGYIILEAGQIDYAPDNFKITLD